jgi:class 3 adenylate cyclase
LASTAPTTPRVASPESYTPKHLAERILDSKAALEGERKQVTVLFADLKGSMELLADRDPEEARKLLDPVLERMMEAVHRYEGTVNQVMGDGIMALFGAPLAHEDHAVRACYAALRMQESVAQYAEGVFRSHAVPLQIRVGLNSGEVVVRAIGSDLHMDYTAVGQTTHLAARMEQMATPGTILLAAATLQLTEGYVQVAARGPVAVKGLPDPVEIYVLTGASTQRTRSTLPPRGDSRASSAETPRSSRSGGHSPSRTMATASSSPSWGNPAWGSPASSTSSPTPTALRTGSSWKRAPSPTARRPAISRSSTSSRPTSRSTIARPTARFVRR